MVYKLILVPVKGLQGLVFSLMDVTDSVLARQRVEDLARQLERHASQLDATMEAIPDGLIVYGPQGEIVRVNDSAREMLGYPDEILRDPLFNRIEYLDVRGPEGFPMAPQETAPARALRGETVRSETVSIRMAGSPGRRWLSLSAAPIRDSEGRMAGAVMTMADITALREAQAHLQEANEELLVAEESDPGRGTAGGSSCRTWPWRSRTREAWGCHRQRSRRPSRWEGRRPGKPGC